MLYLLFFIFFLLILFYSKFKFSYILHIIKLFIFPLFFNIKKIKHIIYYLNSINKIVIIKWSHVRETLILTPNTLKEKWNIKQMSILKHIIKKKKRISNQIKDKETNNAYLIHRIIIKFWKTIGCQWREREMVKKKKIQSNKE